MVEIRQKADYFIRHMEEKDIPQALEIDREAFPTQWPYPTYTSYKQELNNRLAHYIVAYKPIDDSINNYPSSTDINSNRLAEKFLNFFNLFSPAQISNRQPLLIGREHLIGMAGFWLMAGEVHIITIAVRNAFRKQGIGARMLIHVIDEAINLNANVVTLEVRISNNTAQQLYKKFGFKAAGIRHKYYTDNNENALIMTTDEITQPGFIAYFNFLKEDHLRKWGNITTA